MVAICVSLLTRRLRASIIVREVLVVVGFADHRKDPRIAPVHQQSWLSRSCRLLIVAMLPWEELARRARDRRESMLRFGGYFLKGGLRETWMV